MSDSIDQITTPPVGASPIAPGTPDRNGVPFDPARHIARQHPTSGRWMPRGGRKPKSALPSSPTTSGAPDHTAPASPPPASPSSLADSPAAPAPSFDDIERAAGAPPPPPDAPSNPTREDGDATLSPDDTGEIAARAVYAVTGAVIGDHKTASATGAEHANIKRVAAAYCRHRGIAVVGWLAVIGTFIAYLLGDARRETVIDRVKAFFHTKPAPRPVAPAEPEKARENAPTEPVKGQFISATSANPNGVPPLAPVELPASKQ